MTTSKLPARPSLESLRKQAKKLARGIVAGDAGAIGRARAQLPHAELPLSQRDAQLVLAREYGLQGWQDLVKEVNQRLGKGIEWAVSQARRCIHDNEIEGLRQLLAEYPALLSWRADENDSGLLGMATDSFGDSFDAFREQHFTRAACAELLIDAGAVVAPSICDGLIASRARGLLDLFHHRGLLPRSLKFFAALGDVNGIRACLDTNGDDLAEVNQAFMCACHLQHPTASALLLDRSITLDAELGRQIDGGPGRSAFVQYIMADSLEFTNADPAGPWQAFVMRQVVRAVNEGDLTSFMGGLRREAWIMGDPCVKFQVGLIERAVLRDREAFINALLDLNPAVLRSRVPPSRAIGLAFTYAKTHMLPTLLRIWRLPDDLPHAAGNGDLASVTRWFDAAGKPALGDLANHFPANSAYERGNLQWGEPSVQQVLDTALAWAVINSQFEIADFLLRHGADINTNWSSHEPASILHELAASHKNYEAMQFLIDRGIDMTIVDYRWGATAQGWAYHAAKDEKMARWLGEAQQRREQASR
ncbi:MAG TPA: ankyrin repeat domain-containing protein [Terriglobia bacterium]|nr:ankyrin repeat domain-containing protein [Terriglobia bacterium]